MLQVTFRNLLPSETLVGTAHEAYLALRERADAGVRVRCHVTISADRPAKPGAEWVRVQVELLQGRGRSLRVLAEGADAQRVVRSGMAALNGTTARTPALPPAAQYAAAAL